ncbi:MAG TPA: class I SAM-dependent methyltransferase [Gaiellales bacterium]
MIAVAPSPELPQAAARACPVCGATSGRELALASVDAAALDEYAFASRKFPEYMHHRLVECPVCDLVYADPVLDVGAIGEAYGAAAFDSKEEAVYASRTYARLVRALLPRLGGTGAALDIGTGEGSLLEQLLDLGFGRVRGYEPSAAPLAAASPRVRELIVHDVFDAGRAAADGPYDLITCCMTIEHVPDPAQLCRDAHALLAPGGALMIVCHDRRAPLNRALGMRSPIIDIEHLQLFSQASARALLERTGYASVGVRPFANRYPLHYWLKLAPLPRGPKGALVAGARHGALRRLSFPLPVGNLAVTGFRCEDASPRCARRGA